MSRKLIKEQILKQLEDKDTYLILGDVGYGFFDSILDMPNVINFGIREQAMISFAAGLARSGKKVIVYSISPFLVTRAAEQIKIDICAQNLPVVLIGTGSGFSYGNLGPTHHCLEDLSILGGFPNIAIKSPMFPEHFENLFEFNKPLYVRLNRDYDFSTYMSQEWNYPDSKKLHVTSGNYYARTEAALWHLLLEETIYYVCDIKDMDKNIPVDEYDEIFIWDESYHTGFAAMFILEYYEKLANKKVQFIKYEGFAETASEYSVNFSLKGN